MPPPPSSTPPGWYPDPERPGGWRWFDGRTWTEHRSAPGAHAGPTVSQAVEGERGPARLLRTGVLVDAAAWVVQLVALGAQVRLIIDVVRDDDDLERSVPEWFGVAQLLSFVALAVLILRIIWLARAATAGARLGRPARHSPGLAAAGWIIPVVNLWFPFQDVRALLPADSPERARVGWWWALHLVGQLSVVAVALAAFGPLGLQVAAVAVGALAYAASTVLERDLIAAILAGHESALANP